ncbi:hypothetical protein [Streptomyces shenzhenensis]|uniref:Beta-ketoacyl-[acyl-carrier-protein] synthase III N-terminal domain-containing protein n=1 Tax=Streptomyces shenzhenensis TaxID=943815 RepID=A0A3M0I527_9ACTN|nr:hypothetical protein [Streptomyces shenzhenensis]RMB84771.1 hypothetical protein CTZ28_16590 [Streptomyces shenzhenensis]
MGSRCRGRPAGAGLGRSLRGGRGHRRHDDAGPKAPRRRARHRNTTGPRHGGGAAGSAQRVLVIGAETISRYLDPQDPSTSVLFADGAGAAVVRAGVRGTERGEIGPVTLGSDGSLADLIHVPG